MRKNVFKIPVVTRCKGASKLGPQVIYCLLQGLAITLFLTRVSQRIIELYTSVRPSIVCARNAVVFFVVEFLSNRIPRPDSLCVSSSLRGSKIMMRTQPAVISSLPDAYGSSRIRDDRESTKVACSRKQMFIRAENLACAVFASA